MSLLWAWKLQNKFWSHKTPYAISSRPGHPSSQWHMDRLIPLYHLSTWTTIFILHQKQNLINHTWSTNHLLKEMYIFFNFMQYVPQHSLIKILFKIQTTVEFNTRCFWSVTKSSWINDDQTLLGNNCICFAKDIVNKYNARFYFTFFSAAFIVRQPLNLSMHRSYQWTVKGRHVSPINYLDNLFLITFIRSMHIPDFQWLLHWYWGNLRNRVNM